MNKIVWSCYDCDSEPISTRIENDRTRGPVIVIDFACSAVLRSSQDKSGMSGSMVFTGCSHDK